MGAVSRRTLLGAALTVPSVRRSYAETSTVVIAKQFGTIYLQQYVMEQERLLEKQAARVGLPNLAVSYIRLSGTGPITDGMLSGKLHFACGGTPGGLLLWDRTHGAVKSCDAMNADNSKLLTIRPELKTVRDLVPTDRIAMPAVKIGPQAVWLQMAAAAEFRNDEWARFDAQTISRPHPDAMAQMLAHTEINCHYSSNPFYFRWPGDRDSSRRIARRDLQLCDRPADPG